MQLIDHLTHSRLFPSTSHQPKSGVSVQGGEGDVVPDRHGQDQSFGLAVFRDKRKLNPLSGSLRRTGYARLPPTDRDAATHIAQHPKESQQQLPLSLPFKTTQP